MKALAYEGKDVILSFLYVLTAILILLAPYSTYYIKNIDVYFSFFTFIYSITYSLRRKHFNSSYTQIAWIYLFCTLFVFLYTFILHQQLPYTTPALNLSLVFSFLLLPQQERLHIANKYIRILTFLLSISLLEYIVAITTGKLFTLDHLIRDTYYGDWNAIQALFNIVPEDWNNTFYRFQSLTDEPGRVGTLSAVLLFALPRKGYIKSKTIFILCGISSFSLAFYVFLVIYFLKILSIKRSRASIVLLAIIIIVAVILKEEINTLILNRFTKDKVNNRNSSSFLLEFSKLAKSFLLLTGKGNVTYYENLSFSKNNAGLFVMIYQYGIIGSAIFLWASIYTIVKVNKKSIERLFLILIILISSYQRFDWNYIPYILVIYSGILSINNNTTKTKKKHE